MAIPRLPHIRVQLDLITEAWEGSLYLPETAPEIVTIEQVLNHLNDDRRFVRVGTSNPPFIWMIAKDALRWVRWWFDDRESMEKHLSWDRRERIRAVLTNEQRIDGYLVILSPGETPLRVQDFLNRPDRFICVIDQTRPDLWFLNKGHLVKVGHIHD